MARIPVPGLAAAATLLALAAVLASCQQTEEDPSQAATEGPTASCVPIDWSDPESPCGAPEDVAKLCAPNPDCGPPTPAYKCIYAVVGGEASCLPLDDDRVNGFEKCQPVQNVGGAACLPSGAQESTVLGEYPPGCQTCGPALTNMIERGHSIIRWAGTGLIEYYVAPEDEAEFLGLKEIFLPAGATPPPPPYPYSCRYVVVNGEAACLPLSNPAARACIAVDFQDRSACAPEGAQFSADSQEIYEPSVGDIVSKGYIVIKRGNSVIKYNPNDAAPVEFTIAPEDEGDLKALSELFYPRP